MTFEADTAFDQDAQAIYLRAQDAKKSEERAGVGIERVLESRECASARLRFVWSGCTGHSAICPTRLPAPLVDYLTRDAEAEAEGKDIPDDVYTGMANYKQYVERKETTSANTYKGIVPKGVCMEA
jgi:hypothetical protein